MKGQLTIDLSEITKQKSQIEHNKYIRHKWRKGIQRYCNETALKEGSSTGRCVCGWMNYCDECLDSGDKMACAKAICKLVEKQKVSVDYADDNYAKFIDELEEK